jgi:hypothetical protein
MPLLDQSWVRTQGALVDDDEIYLSSYTPLAPADGQHVARAPRGGGGGVVYYLLREIEPSVVKVRTRGGKRREAQLGEACRSSQRGEV